MGLLIVINVAFLIYTMVVNKQESNRLKNIEAAKIEWEEAVEAQKHAKREAALNRNVESSKLFGESESDSKSQSIS